MIRLPTPTSPLTWPTFALRIAVRALAGLAIFAVMSSSARCEWIGLAGYQQWQTISKKKQPPPVTPSANVPTASAGASATAGSVARASALIAPSVGATRQSAVGIVVPSAPLVTAKPSSVASTSSVGSGSSGLPRKPVIAARTPTGKVAPTKKVIMTGLGGGGSGTGSGSTTQPGTVDVIPNGTAMASLSGIVFLDLGDDGLDMGDWAIREARVGLYRDNTQIQVVETNLYGQYVFNFEAPTMADYCIKLLLNARTPGTENPNLMRLVDGTGSPCADPGAVTWDTDHQSYEFTGIHLGPAYHGEMYNFAELIYPLELITKRLIIIPPELVQIPEPSTLIYLSTGLLTGLATMFRRGRAPRSKTAVRGRR